MARILHAAMAIMSDGRRIDFAARRPNPLTIAFTALWFAGWLFLLALTIVDYARFGSVPLFSVVMFFVAGPPVGLALLWATLGERESFIVSPAEVRIIRWVGPFRLQRAISAPTVTGLRTVSVTRERLFDLIAARKFYSGGCGSIAIDTSDRTFSVGHTLPAADAAPVTTEISRVLPQLGTRSSEPGKPRRRAIDYAAGFMTAAMIGFAIKAPTHLLITDRPICFYDDRVVPRDPIDVSRIHPAGRVLLVPIEDFPIDRAMDIAAHFRQKFGIPIDVAPVVAWPADAYVESRRQMNSAAMLARLESTYARTETPVIVIGLTTRDMFNPEVNWTYVFSYRRDNRLAVVSPTRMDRGCMGLFQASEDRVTARLRKMVGKNIGIMYFGLGLSGDPRSMLYAQIGGPQELDAMSELF